MLGSASFSLGVHDWKAIGKAGGYSALTGLLGFIGLQLQSFNFPPQDAAIFVIVLPILNSALVAAKRYCENRSSVVEDPSQLPPQAPVSQG